MSNFEISCLAVQKSREGEQLKVVTKFTEFCTVNEYNSFPQQLEFYKKIKVIRCGMINGKAGFDVHVTVHRDKFL